jgi:hypothetical protein
LGVTVAVHPYFARRAEELEAEVVTLQLVLTFRVAVVHGRGVGMLRDPLVRALGDAIGLMRSRAKDLRDMSLERRRRRCALPLVSCPSCTEARS